jgi:ubiquitin carboxyl-terminal hydrolase 4/11
MKPKRKKNGGKNSKHPSTHPGKVNPGEEVSPLEAGPSPPAIEEDVLSHATACHQSGNRAFGEKNYEEAMQQYTQGIQLLKPAIEAMGAGESVEMALRKLYIVLHGNRALVHWQRQEYAPAEVDCSTILEDPVILKPHPQLGWKLWYRRALAREQLACQCYGKSTPEDGPHEAEVNDQSTKHGYHSSALLYIAQAQQDLEQCRVCIAEESSNVAEREEIPTALERMELLQQHMMSSDVPKNTVAVVLPSPLSVQEQRQDILRLLQGRGQLYPGEAYFLLDWIWWSEWCQHVHLFESQNFTDHGGDAMDVTVEVADPIVDVTVDEGMEDQRPTEQVTNEETPATFLSLDDESILQLLPPGAVRPDPVDEEDQRLGPGPIDNSSLLLPHPKDWNSTTQTVFYKHWYRPYYHQGASSVDDFIPLKPGLVRGYHYEILPREVYNALRTWYSELTPSICRRATSAEDVSPIRIILYPLWDHFSTSATKETTTPGECSACAAVGATMKCGSCRKVCYCNRTCQNTDWKRHKPECSVKNASKAAATAVSLPNRGRTGLNNLGNTCFMNSAIQCLSHATPLTRHFRSGQFQFDVNDANPLGTGGQLAHAYADVMKALHQGSQRTCSPTQLKRAIAMFAPRFAGYLQHDAQEFLAYLLDGLHEDLNRIRKAPYVEMPDVTDGQCIAVAGARAWDAHHRRNDSLVLDTFYGQFKSTCVCPKCHRVSVSFDAYNHVSLEIPQEIKTIGPIAVIVYPSPTKENPFPQPTRYSISMRHTDLISDLKDATSSLCGIPMARLQFCEIQKNAITGIHPDTKLLSLTPLNRIMAYDVHPMGSDAEHFFHAIATHKILADTSPNGALVFDSFGVPIMTSFETTYTCRDVWNHIWSMIDFCVSESPGGKIEIDHLDVNAQSMLQIRLVSQQGGKPVLVFPKSNGCSHPIGTAAETEKSCDTEDSDSPNTSVLPHDCDETFVSFVGTQAISNFLFFYLEWADLVDPELQDGEERPDEALRQIDEERFLAVQNHDSYIQAVKQAKSNKEGSMAVTLDQCFDTFTKPERLDKHNMWYCSSCKDHVQALKTMELWKLPNVLIVHLKRFEFKHSLRRDKLDTLVEFPLSGLDMNAHLATVGDKRSCVDDRVPSIYDCFAVVNHFGRMGFGHYTAYARPWNEAGISNDWALFDDSSVRSVVGDGSIVSSAAYVLLYRRRIFS